MESSSNTDLPHVLTVEEAARFLGINRKTLYDSISRREFPARKVGARYCIHRDTMIEWLKGDIKKANREATA